MAEPVIVATARTPIGRASKGSLVDARPDDMSAFIVKDVLSKVAGLDPAEVEDIIWGIGQPGGEGGFNIGRIIAVMNEMEVPGVTVNRYCSSSLQTIRMAAHAIKAGEGDCFVAGGVETVSRYMNGAADTGPHNELFADAEQRSAERTSGESGNWEAPNGLPDVYIAMGQTAENVAEHYNINREDQDLFAFNSQKKYQEAKKNGRFKSEIIPVEVPQKRGDPLIFEEDEHPRETDLDKMAKLPTPFKENGTVTAGNASGVNDGAGCLLIASEDMVKKYSLRPLARYCGGATAGVEPKYMGIGPVFSTRKILRSLNIKMDQIGLIELNEAFASQSLACIRELNMNENKVNIHGGAIALGHPLGATGSRITGKTASLIKKNDKRFGLATQCIGLGQGIATILENIN